MRSIFDEMTKKGLNIHSCPISPGNYFSRGLHINDNRLPPILPMGRVFMRIEQFMGTEDNLTLVTSTELTAIIKNNFGLRING